VTGAENVLEESQECSESPESAEVSLDDSLIDEEELLEGNESCENLVEDVRGEILGVRKSLSRMQPTELKAAFKYEMANAKRIKGGQEAQILGSSMSYDSLRDMSLGENRLVNFYLDEVD
jgi:hypothetical protein